MWDDEYVVDELTVEECWMRLRAGELGRLAICVTGRVDIFPVNYHADGRHIYFRTAPGTKLLELTVDPLVAFEIDGATVDDAWSVVAHGTATRIQLQSEIDDADLLPLTPWIPTLKYAWVRIEPSQLTGRRFDRATEPERY
jgi:nitroimidazol reductase NimA-like FMN-containing flavoprotein (pyridoxamine 5'-phosphate oxidase superfamily)